MGRNDASRRQSRTRETPRYFIITMPFSVPLSLVLTRCQRSTSMYVDLDLELYIIVKTAALLVLPFLPPCKISCRTFFLECCTHL